MLGWPGAPLSSQASHGRINLPAAASQKVGEHEREDGCSHGLSPLGPQHIGHPGLTDERPPR